MCSILVLLHSDNRYNYFFSLTEWHLNKVEIRRKVKKFHNLFHLASFILQYLSHQQLKSIGFTSITTFNVL